MGNIFLFGTAAIARSQKHCVCKYCILEYCPYRNNLAVKVIIKGGCRRLRPILLTSLTTFFGLVPMLFETDIQARFLIPMAISLGFGVLFATVVILILVPSIYIVLEDFVGMMKRIANWFSGEASMEEPQSAK